MYAGRIADYHHGSLLPIPNLVVLVARCRSGSFDVVVVVVFRVVVVVGFTILVIVVSRLGLYIPQTLGEHGFE